MVDRKIYDVIVQALTIYRIYIINIVNRIMNKNMAGGIVPKNFSSENGTLVCDEYINFVNRRRETSGD